MSRRILWWGVAPAIVLLVLSAGFAAALRPSRLRAAAEEELARRLNLETSIGELGVSLLPTPRAYGRAVELRIPGRPDLPPFITIDQFSVGLSPLTVLRRRVGFVEAQGLTISVPPGEDRGALPDFGGDGDGDLSKVLIEEFSATAAELRFVPREPDDSPLVFAIHALTVTGIGAERRMGFDATLTNPVPRGLVRANGQVGPWMRTDAGSTHVEGEYVFEDADLSTINGIGGILQSTGTFAGDLRAIRVHGESTIPEFSLDLAERPVPLKAAFETVVNGTDGSVGLERVDATLIETRMQVTGAIRNLPGPGNRRLDLNVHVGEGRVEDLLALVLDGPKPVMTGDVSLEAVLALPPGPGRARDRLAVSGRFGLNATQFTSAQVQQKLQELSRRSQGKDEDDPIGRVLTDLSGQFALDTGVISLKNLSFRVPGARVALAGTYQLAGGRLDFRGTLRMDASASEAVGGFKSIFIRPFDGLFRKDGAGAVLPIRIEGTRAKPEFGLEVSRIF